MTADQNAASPRAFAALRRPGYAVYLTGSMLAMMADSIEHVISYWIIFEKFRSPALGGYAVVSHWLPFLLFSVYAGALADRFDPRRLIQFGMLLFMLCSLAWGVLFFTDTLEIWHAVVLLSIHGMAGVFWAPASQLLVHDIVGRDQLHSAVRLMAISRTLGLLGGPAVGGVMLLVLGPTLGILLNVLIYLPLTLWLWRAPYGPRFRTAAVVLQAGVRNASGIWQTMREIAGNRTVMSMILLTGASSFFVGHAYQPQMPEFAADLGHEHAEFHYSMLLAANAVGALAAGLCWRSPILRARPRTAVILVIAWCLCITGFALSTNYLLSLALLVTAGFLNLAYGAMSQTLVQLLRPNTCAGVSSGSTTRRSTACGAFSGVTVGMAGALIGIHWSLALSALLLLLTALGAARP